MQTTPFLISLLNYVRRIKSQVPCKRNESEMRTKFGNVKGQCSSFFYDRLCCTSTHLDTSDIFGTFTRYVTLYQIDTRLK